MTHKPFLGCIADDFTGASDLAGFLAESGMRTLQINSVPTTSPEDYQQFDAIVIALKSRSEPVQTAVAESLSALQWLRQAGCEKFYFKYCSTFDSTNQGNIGPVTDALLNELEQTCTIVCPALPVNGRTIYKGHLFVFDQPLHESPMKNHPITPMRDSSLIRLMEAQSTGKAINIPYQIVDQGEAALTAELERLSKTHQYLVIDALKTEHLITLGHCCKPFKLVTGGSGLAIDLCAEFEPQGFVRKAVRDSVSSLKAPTVVLSGSCSAMTQQQVAAFKENHSSLFLDPFALRSGELTLDTISEWIKVHISKEIPLIYATAAPDFVARVHQEIGNHESQLLLENTLSAVAGICHDLGVRNFVVAGGETSGAVVKHLAISQFQIGPIITPGVPMVQTLGEDKINLALKSGNFGQADFFSKAVEVLSC